MPEKVARAIVRLAMSYVSMPPEADHDVARDLARLMSPFAERYGVIDPVAALTWDVPEGPAVAAYRVKQLPPPVVVLPPDRGPITLVVLTGVGLALVLGIGALARRAMRRR